ncbi:DEAD/DEAH box helicase [Patescibacteria group bacterium]|nr:DEAD/DEAH box helicase [Patescibacteria group bacterium]MBU1075174.1 DEAD/DEAH box helicase [Patescibacteria group bacterium]MBU1951968.1 DEAD/DEAH box helicase [Patescibacteria group bacterium]
MNQESTSNFYGLGLAPKLLQILDKNRFTVPTPIQAKTIPLAIEGKDLIGIAQTGTGKTLAFGLPMIQNIARKKTRGLILVPTRELAAQADEMLMRFGRPLGLKIVVVIGGASMGMQTRALRNNPHIIIATPGRLIDHLSHNLKLLNEVGVLTLDEADRMLDMGFAPQIEKILIRTPKTRQTLLYSATMPQSILAIANRHMHLPLRVEIAQPGTTVKEIDQEVVFLAANNKTAMLKTVLDKYSGSILVFSRTKWGAKKLAIDIRRMNHTAAEIHSNRTLAQRRAAIEGFKNGKHRILVATDIAARGIDVNNIEVVVNYDLPGSPDDYVHRIGRTARAGKKGKAISFATPDQHRDIRDIEKLIRTQIVLGEGSAYPKEPAKTKFNSRNTRRSYSRSRPRGNRGQGRRRRK